jgi:hypothetical protein
MSENCKNFLHRIFDLVGAKSAPAPVETKPVVANDTPAWLEISTVNRASVESAVHLELQRQAQADSIASRMTRY